MPFNNIMKTVLIASSFKANYGGNFIAQISFLADNLEKVNCEVLFLFPEKAKEKKWCILFAKNRNVFFIKDDLSGFNRLKFAYKFVKKNNVSIAHTHFGLLALQFALLCLLSKRFKHIIHAHSEAPLPANFYRRLLQYLKHGILLKKSFVIAVNQNIQRQYISYGFKTSRLQTIHNGIDFNRLLCLNKNIDFRKDLQISSDAKLFLMMGYNIYIKGIDVAIDAFLHLKNESKSFDNYALCIVIASNFEMVKHEIMDKYQGIPSWLYLLKPTETVSDYYRMVDCFISASRTEGFPYSIAEAIFMKLPVIMSNIDGTKWATQFPSVISFESTNAFDLKNKIENIFSTISSEMETTSSASIENILGITVWADNVINFYYKYNLIKL